MGAFGLDRASGHSVQRLLDDLHALAHFIEAEQVAGPDVAIVRNRHAKLKFLVAAIRHVAAEVEIDAGGAHDGAGDAERDRILFREVANTLEPIDEDRIAGEEVGILVDLFRECLDEGLNALEESEGRLHREPADAEVAGHHPLAGHHLEDAENFFALAEGVEEHGEGANVHGMRAQPDEVRIEAGDLGEQDANPLGALGDFELKELLDGQAVTEVVGHGAEIIDAVGEGNDLLVELRFAGFFDAGVKVADFGIEADDDFAVDFEHQAQHAVGGRVLRSHVEDHVLVFGAFSQRSFKDRGADNVWHQR